MVGRKSRVVYIVKYFGGAEFRIELEKSVTGLFLLKSSASFKGIKDYGLLGLRYKSHLFPGVYFWIDEMKSLGKQIDESSEMFLCFKYYDPDPRKITNAVLRNMLYIQLRWDLIHNRIRATEENYVKLSAYTLRIENGYDEDAEQFMENYNKYVFWPRNVNFSKSTRSNIRDLVYQKYLQLKSISIEAAQLTYLDICSKLDRYGMYYYPVSLPNEKNILYYLGINSQGIFILDLKMEIHRRIPWQLCFDGITAFKKNVEIIIKPEFCNKNFELPKPTLSFKRARTMFSVIAFDQQVCENIYSYTCLAHCFYVIVNLSGCKMFQTMPSLFGSKRTNKKIHLPYTLYQMRLLTEVDNSEEVSNFLREKSDNMKCDELHLMGVENLNTRLRAKSTRSMLNDTQDKPSSIKKFASLRQTLKQKKEKKQGKKVLNKFNGSFRRRSNTKPVTMNEHAAFTPIRGYSYKPDKEQEEQEQQQPSQALCVMKRHIPSFNFGRLSSQPDYGKERISYELLKKDTETFNREFDTDNNKNNIAENDLFEPIRSALFNIFGNTDGLFPIDLRKVNENWKNGLSIEKLDSVAETLKRISNTTPPRDFSSTCENSDSGCAKEWISKLCVNGSVLEKEGETIDEMMDRLSAKFKLCEINSPEKNENPMIITDMESNVECSVDCINENIIQR